MKLLRYYRTGRQDVLTAWKNDSMAVARLEGEAQAFADQFGATAMFTTGFESRFVGITFAEGQKPKHPELWTKKSDVMPMQMPKATGVPQAMQAESMSLRMRYQRSWPQRLVEKRLSETLAIMGLSDDQLQQELFHFQPVGSEAYIAASFQLELPGFDEITGSAYIAKIEESEKASMIRNQPKIIGA